MLVNYIKMRIIITESQLKYILKEECYPLNIKDGTDIPDNIYGTQVAVNNLDKDASDDVTITDNPSHKRAMSNRLFARSRNVCEAEFDDNRSQNFGKNEKSNIISTANNSGGKMVSNLANDIQNGGARNNTNQVRASRLKAQKKNDPITFIKNGGNETLNALKSSTTKESNKNALTNVNSVQSNPMMQVPNQNKGTGKGHSHGENEGNIYYY